MASKNLILASSSPRRAQILTDAGYDFDVVVPRLDEPDHKEPHISNIKPSDFAQAIAYFKASQIARQYPQAIVIGADTIVVCKDRIIGKADDAGHAREILTLLSHNRHCVITGIAIVKFAENRRMLDYDCTWLTMKPMSSEQIDEYIASGQWQGKAGAYALQQGGDKFVAHIEGSYSNVIGLPIELTSKILEQFGIRPLKSS